MRGSRTWLNALRAIEGQGMIDGREMQREMEKCMTTEGEAKQIATDCPTLLNHRDRSPAEAKNLP